MYEELLTRKLKLELQENGYPSDAVIEELAVRNPDGRVHYIDLAIIDPISSSILAIFEVKKNLDDNQQIRKAIAQIKSYSKSLPDLPLLFLFCSNEDKQFIYSADVESNNLEPLNKLPSFESLLSSQTLKGVDQTHRKDTSVAKKWSNIVAGMSSSIAIAALLITSFGLFFDSSSKTLGNKELTLELSTMKAKTYQSQAIVENLERELNEVKGSLSLLSDLPEEQKWKIEVSKLQANVEVLSNKIESLESVLTSDPTKALAVPLLRKDLESTEKTLTLELLQTRAELERMYDQNKWFIGLMFTIALSVLGMVASSWFNRKET
ncbi:MULTISPECIES: type I restriction enzyme HsdR N-terminal domain-containing protein [Vibrio]|uniref:Type I restriction enzyme R protein N-terminal domain-containing protein n=6 Tax=Vibrio lentus TaxID=136468 RepID=A0AA44VUI6_9VIBR|nr:MULTISPECIES: type I restriction enzyme HsdR N-terminal domain-containing protein [Vibrio]MCB5360445.1 hypothetical protein [Vibrio lentus]MCB5450729.1 hypothetical protein [Vibrio lentus]MCB5463762.1 hypothetical protein [Vibrio lentus]MCC4791624.1 type I restriction enzyme HsdR N-terminal domain-containing protein [Vibrio lentus]MCC5481660.1 hypothetical protein [Vibrio lentus]